MISRSYHCYPFLLRYLVGDIYSVFYQLFEMPYFQRLPAIRDVEIPNSALDQVDFVDLEAKEDFEKIPSGGGCYWIWTNEPVNHSLHKNSTPSPFDDGEIIYNGIAKDDVKGRIFHHLLGAPMLLVRY